MDARIKNEKIMMKPLRKRHLQIWMAWAILLPVGIVVAWLSVPEQKPVKLLQSHTVEVLPVIKNTKDLDNYTINIRVILKFTFLFKMVF